MSAKKNKTLVVIAAGFGWNLIQKHPLKTRFSFRPIQPAGLGLTCPAQATLRTALPIAEHGVVASGWFHADLARPYFWEQSAALVKGPRVWEAARAAGQSVGMAFWQQSLGEQVDVVISPKPIHRHHGGIVMECYSRPEPLYAELIRAVGRKFDLYHYWGLWRAPKSGAGFPSPCRVCWRGRTRLTICCVSAHAGLRFTAARA